MPTISDSIELDLQHIVDFINSHEIEIGVVDGSGKVEREERIGINNAELLFIHENGSPIRNIPARPVLDITIHHAMTKLVKDVYDKCIDGYLKDGWTDEEIEKELEKFCIRLQNYARDVIYANDGRLAPNKPSTIRSKGFDHPLFVTGQLARSITCRLVKK